MSEFPHKQEDFVVVRADMVRVGHVMTDQSHMERWTSPAVRFTPLDGWRFDRGARWRLSIPGLGSLLEADYSVFDRREGLILWAFDGFWEGFDAWHWRPHGGSGETLIQNRIEYRLKVPGLSLIWPATVGPLMGWDADVQMRRLQQVCEE
ncbi:SRPBCC family protein [Chloroflexales bacterium ZM16-3]|nr:SRPBCC family protein [Chloroflexales bacterium ZM16-3]